MQPVTITLYEHQTRSYQEIGLSPDHPVLEQLDQINQQAKKEIITLGRTGIRANEMVGLIRVDQIIFQVLPKIDHTEGNFQGPEGKANAAVLNLLFLLSYAYDLKLYQPDLAQLARACLQTQKRLCIIGRHEQRRLIE